MTDAMEQGALEGMQTFDGVIEEMIREGIVNKDEALSYATNHGNLLLRLADFGGVAAPPRPAAEKKESGSMLDMIE